MPAVSGRNTHSDRIPAIVEPQQDNSATVGWTRRARLKTIAIVLGAIVTIKVGPMAILSTVAASGQFLKNPVFALWPACGVIGLIGFWLWAFSRRALYGRKRVAFSTLIVIGMVTIAPFIFLGGVLLAVAGLGVAASVLALAEMWLPGKGFKQ